MHCGVQICQEVFFLPPTTSTNVLMNVKIELQSNRGLLGLLVPVFNVLKSYGCLNIIYLLSGTGLIYYNLWESKTLKKITLLIANIFASLCLTDSYHAVGEMKR